MRTRLILFLLACQLTFAAAVNYSYDAAGRLVKIDYGAAGSISYTYDNAGNVASRTVQSSGAGASASASAITSARLVHANKGEARIEIAGTNLAADAASVTIDGQPARIVSRCNAGVSRACQTDQVTVLAPELETSGKVRIVVTNGTRSSEPFWVLIHGRQTPKP